ncbi:MAG: 30S ribosomal protein S17 [Oligoflexus sp.]
MSDNKDNVKKSKPILGVVTSDKMNKSRVATVERFVKHTRYHKYIKRRTKIMFHDEQNSTKVGDAVLLMPSRPYSARKKFDLLRVVQPAGEV